MEYNEIKSFILSGCKYMYESYDHKKALEFYQNDWKGEKYPADMTPDCHYMPNEIKNKFKMFRIGKLRQVEFSPIGTMWRFKIGAKRAKTYFKDDFGVTVKPILDPKKDRLKLIKRGLAVSIHDVEKKKKP